METQCREKIDALFKDFDRPDYPGCALGVIVDGEMVYSRGYGIAKLEYGIPVTDKTVFHIASLSKQFTAMCIALLEEQGLVSLDDDICSHFPELPRYPWPITVGNLVYMTNGIYDIYSLANFILGVRENDFFTREQAWEMVKACDWLMFRPGEQWSYGNTGYFLLAELVERLTGKTLSEFAHENIFLPLGMSNTFFRDDRTKIIRNRAEGYSNYAHIHYNTLKQPWSTRGQTLLVNSDSMELPGAGQVWSTVKDLYLWDQNFYFNKLGKASPQLISKVTTPGTLDNGKPISYAYGLFVGNKAGYAYTSHGGWSHGWSCYMHRIPAKKCSVICLANHTDSYWPLEVWEQSYSIPEQIMELVLKDFKISRPDPKPELQKTLDQSVNWDQLVGRYQDPQDSWLLKIEVRDGKCVADLCYGRVLDLEQVGAGTFMAAGGSEIFNLEPEGKLVMQDGDKKRVFHRFSQPGKVNLEEYAGEYRCAAVDTTFSVGVEGDCLQTLNKNRRNTAIDFLWSPSIRDTFLAEYPPYSPFYCITFNRNDAGAIVSMVFRDDEGSKRENFVFVKIG